MNGKPPYPSHNMQNRGGSPPLPPPESLKGYEQSLNDYKKNINSEKFTNDNVLNLSEKLAYYFSQRVNREGKETTRTQLRKFYNLVKVAQTSASAQKDNIDKVKIKLRILQAQVTYAVARPHTTLHPDIKAFFDSSIDKIIKSADLKSSLDDFSTLFESLYAYFYYHTREK